MAYDLSFGATTRLNLPEAGKLPFFRTSAKLSTTSNRGNVTTQVR
jgi:hypothetical protein